MSKPEKPKSLEMALMEDRMRIASILRSPEGTARPKLAVRLACEMGRSLEEAREMLADFPAENPFLEAMSVHGPVGLSSFTPSDTIGRPADPKAARLAELSKSVNAFNVSRGFITQEQADARVAAVKHNPAALAKRIAR